MADKVSIVADKKFIPHGVLHYFSLGKSCGQIVENLLRSHENDPTLFPRVNAQEIEFWYNSFKIGNFDLEQEPTLDPRLMLGNIPVLNQVIHNNGAANQQVSNVFNSFIEGENRIFKSVELHLYKDSVVLNVKNGIDSKQRQKAYKKKERGCEIVDFKETKSESDEDFIEAAVSDFRTIVGKVHTRIETLFIKHRMNQVDESDRTRFFERAAEVMNSVNRPLYVENINMTLYESAELDPFLKAVKPGILKRIDLFTNKEVTGEGVGEVEHDRSGEQWNADATNKPLKLKDVPSYDIHSQHLLRLVINSYIGDVNIADFAHIPRVTLFVSKLKRERLAAYKEILLQQKNFTAHWFSSGDHIQFNATMLKECSDALQPYDNEGLESGKDEISGSFAYPAQDGGIIKFTLGVNSTFIKQ